MNYYDDSTARKLVMLEIENRKAALEFYEKIVPVVKRFDGKVFNIRFENALKDVAKNLNISTNYSSFLIVMRLSNDHVFSDEVRFDGYHDCAYVCCRELQLNTYLNKELVLNNKRINADVLLKSLESGNRKLQEDIVSMENALEKVDEYKKRLEELRAEMGNIVDGIPFLIRNYFNLNYRIRRD